MSAGAWVYQTSEPGLLTVGFYDPSGRWRPDSDFDTREGAAARVAYLNGGANPDLAAALLALAHQSETVAALPTCGEREFLLGLAKAARGAVAKAARS